MLDFLSDSDTSHLKHYQIGFSGKFHAIYMRTGFDKEVKRIPH